MVSRQLNPTDVQQSAERPSLRAKGANRDPPATPRALHSRVRTATPRCLSVLHMSGVLCCVAVRFSVSRPACVRLPGGGMGTHARSAWTACGERRIRWSHGSACARLVVTGREQWMCWWSESPWLLSIPYGAFTFLTLIVHVETRNQTDGETWSVRR